MLLYKPTIIITQFAEIKFYLFLQAKEIEVQTHCDVKVLLKPNWQHGKTHEYSSSRQSSGIIFKNKEVQKNIPDPELITSSPKKKRKNLYVITKQTDSIRGCRVCGKSDDRCCWIGCGHKNKVTKEEDCNYWVHQWCIGLHYKTEQKLILVPFYCEEHGSKKQK